MKIIFLDIDGVLNSMDSMKRKKGIFFDDNPDEVHIGHLNHIIEETGAKVVISSTWRKGTGAIYLWRLLDQCGFKGKVLGTTPDTGDIRGNEIRCWMDRYNNRRDWKLNRDQEDFDPIESFVILDDDSDMGDLLQYLVRCDGEKGLLEKEAEQAIKILRATL
jgi:hypothetical protein